MSEPTKFQRALQSSKNRGKLCMPPHNLDSPEAVLPASGFPAKADRLLPAMMAARTEVSCPKAGERSADRLLKSSGYIAVSLSKKVLDKGKNASETIEA